MRTLRAADSKLDAGETVLLSGLRGPANHDGGGIDIGPDGLLYVGVGDTGCNSGQAPEPIYTPTNFYGTCLADDGANHGGGNGKVLRIGLDGSIYRWADLHGEGLPGLLTEQAGVWFYKRNLSPITERPGHDPGHYGVAGRFSTARHRAARHPGRRSPRCP